METLRDKLTLLMQGETAQVLARRAPLGLVAAISGGIIGAALGAPAFAAAGLGVVLTSLATNMVSSLLYDVVRPDADEEARSIAIQHGLEQRDPQIVALVADALTALGPQLAESLVAAQRPNLLPALSSGMQKAGGFLASVEPAISAALASPQADWSALQQGVAQHITSVELAAETSDKARMTNNEMRVDNAAGPVRISAKASGESVMDGNRQIVTGMSPGPAARSAPGERAAAGADDPQQQRALLAATIARLKVRELQRAQYGIDAPPHVVTELEDLRVEVARLRARLAL